MIVDAKLRWIVSLLLLVVAGCMTTPPGAIQSQELEAPLTALQRTVDESLPFGVRKVSSNGREFSSKYFLTRGQKLRRAKNTRARMYAKVTILGAQRPYTLEVIVHKEKYRGQSGVQRVFDKVGTDKRIAKALVKRIQNNLTKRLKDTNVIDDFRAF